MEKAQAGKADGQQKRRRAKRGAVVTANALTQAEISPMALCR